MEYSNHNAIWNYPFAWAEGEGGERSYRPGRVALAFEKPSGRPEIVLILGKTAKGILFVPIDRFGERIFALEEFGIIGPERAEEPLAPICRVGPRWELA